MAGLVIDGAVRDIDAIRETSFPVFSRGLAIGSCTKERPGKLDIADSTRRRYRPPGRSDPGRRGWPGRHRAGAPRCGLRNGGHPTQAGVRRSSASFAKDGPRSSCWVWWTRGIAERARSAPGAAVNAQRYRHEDLYDFGCRVLERLDVPAGDAAEVSACLTKAELRGVDSHGMVRLPVYSRQAAGWRGEGATRHPGHRHRVRRRRSSTATTGSVLSSAPARWTRRWIWRGTWHRVRRRPEQQSFRARGVLRREGRRAGMHRAGDLQRAAEHGAVRRKDAASSAPIPSPSACLRARSPR